MDEENKVSEGTVNAPVVDESADKDQAESDVEVDADVPQIEEPTEEVSE